MTSPKVLLAFLIPLTAHAEPYGWTPAKPASLNSFIKVTGRVIPQDGALNIESARVQGRIVNILAREGDSVRAGIPLFAVNSSECTSLAEEKRVAERRKLEDLLFSVIKREKQLGLKVTDERCEIVATSTGIVTKRSLESGAAFNVGDPLVTLLDTKRLAVELDLSERDVSLVQAGQKVNFHLAADAEKMLTSAVKSVVPAIDSTTRTARVRLMPTSLPTNASLDGLVFGEIENKSTDPIYTIPARAIIFSKNSRYVVKGPEKTASAVEVEVLGEANDQASVRPRRRGELRTSDLVATDQVIYLYRKLNEGSIQP